VKKSKLIGITDIILKQVAKDNLIKIEEEKEEVKIQLK